jgi:predicted lactoylglutathione lyase
MFSRGIEDPNGHVWKITWMDPAAMGGAPADV